MVFVADELGVLKISPHLRGDFIDLNAFAQRLCFADKDDGASAVEAEGWPEFRVVDGKIFTVERSVAWPCALVENGAVLPERDFVFEFLRSGVLRSCVA